MNPIQQAIVALEHSDPKASHYAEARERHQDALTSLRSLQKEGAELPAVTAEDRRYLTDNPDTDGVIAWMQDYARTAIAAALGRAAPVRDIEAGQPIPVANSRPLEEVIAELREQSPAFAEAMDAQKATQPAPIDMVLYCPKCGKQHIDAPEVNLEEQPDGSLIADEHWTNPPHRSHLCHTCGCTWRPADVPTNGVAVIKTQGKADTWFGGWSGRAVAAEATQPTQAEAPGDHGGPIAGGWQLSVAHGHSGYGVYAHMDEYPEEGAVLVLPLATQPPASQASQGEREALRACDAVCERIIEQDGGILGGVDFHALRKAIRAALATQQAGFTKADMNAEYARGRADGWNAACVEEPPRRQQAAQGEPVAPMTDDEITLLLADKIGFGDSALQDCNRSDLQSIIRAVEARYTATGQVERDREDAELLDWLDAKNKPFKMGWQVGVAPAGNVVVKSVIYPITEPVSIRSAIRAARSSEGGAA